MKILLVSPNTLAIPYPVYPLGLDYVAASIPSVHDVRIADLNTLTLEEFDETVITFSPDIIGLSCRNIDNTDAGEYYRLRWLGSGRHSWQNACSWVYRTALGISDSLESCHPINSSSLPHCIPCMKSKIGTLSMRPITFLYSLDVQGIFLVPNDCVLNFISKDVP